MPRLGPVSLEQKVRQIARQARQELSKDDLRKPQELTVQDIAEQENETSRNVEGVYRCLLKHQPINYFVFVVNPHSFSQTVENIFYFSFLIRDGKAKVELDEDDMPMICKTPGAASRLSRD